MDLWYTRCPLPTASGIAIERGLLDARFAPQGVRVQSLNASTQRSVREAHFSHAQPGLFREGGSMPPLWARSRGADTVLLATTAPREYQAVIALPDSALAAPADLRGRRLGVPRRVNDSFDYWRAMCLRGFEAALGIAGLKLGDAVLVDLPVEETQIPDGGASTRGTLWRGAARARRQSREALALVRGEVDAIYTASAPGAQLTAFLGARVVADIGADAAPEKASNNQTPCVLTADAGLLRVRRQLVIDYLDALLDASDWAAVHPQEARGIIGDDVAATGEWVIAANGDDVHRRLQPGFDAAHLRALNDLQAFLGRQGFIEEPVDIASWADPSPLHEALARREGR